jgi:hypothetical protein
MSLEIGSEAATQESPAAGRQLPDVRRDGPRGARLACEAVVSKAKDRADSPLCRALGRDEIQVLT